MSLGSTWKTAYNLVQLELYIQYDMFSQTSYAMKYNLVQLQEPITLWRHHYFAMQPCVMMLCPLSHRVVPSLCTCHLACGLCRIPLQSKFSSSARGQSNVKWGVACYRRLLWVLLRNNTQTTCAFCVDVQKYIQEHKAFATHELIKYHTDSVFLR